MPPLMAHIARRNARLLEREDDDRVPGVQYRTHDDIDCALGADRHHYLFRFERGTGLGVDRLGDGGAQPGLARNGAVLVQFPALEECLEDVGRRTDIRLPRSKVDDLDAVCRLDPRNLALEGKSC